MFCVLREDDSNIQRFYLFIHLFIYLFINLFIYQMPNI